MTTLPERHVARRELEQAREELTAEERKSYDALCRQFMEPCFTAGRVRWRIYDPDGERHLVPEDEWPDAGEAAAFEMVLDEEPSDDYAPLWGYKLSAPGFLDQTGWSTAPSALDAIRELLELYADDLPEETA